jgi:hypothetical protein
LQFSNYNIQIILNSNIDSEPKAIPDSLKTPNFNIKYLPNGRKYLSPENAGKFGVENWIGLFSDF